MIGDIILVNGREEIVTAEEMITAWRNVGAEKKSAFVSYQFMAIKSEVKK